MPRIAIQLHCFEAASYSVRINFNLDPENYSDNGNNYNNFLYMHILSIRSLSLSTTVNVSE